MTARPNNEYDRLYYRGSADAAGRSDPAFDRLLKAYRYRLPKRAIADRPAAPRDASKLLVYSRSTRAIAITRFSRLPNVLPPKSLLVFNDTKVIPARLPLEKTSGGHVRLLATAVRNDSVSGLVDRGLVAGTVLSCGGVEALRFLGRTGSLSRFKLLVTESRFRAMLAARGETPLPPYLKRSPLTESERRRAYQSLFARAPGSIAAPTASLHFTEHLRAKLRRAGFSEVHITLHVGLGTFAPLVRRSVEKGTLHAERYAITKGAAAALSSARREGRPVIAVGTTVARALESAARGPALAAGERETHLFIRPPYRFRVIDGLITNFHVPASSLMMLVASLIGRRELLRVYRYALTEKFRFLSFGDAMLIRP